MAAQNSGWGYSNGADGSCQNCGAETAEEWHAFCPDCYRVEMGWDEPDDEPAVLPLTEECPSCGERRVLFPFGPDARRECLDCVRAHR